MGYAYRLPRDYDPNQASGRLQAPQAKVLTDAVLAHAQELEAFAGL